jgi:hypothetical protein
VHNNIHGDNHEKSSLEQKSHLFSPLVLDNEESQNNWYENADYDWCDDFHDTNDDYQQNGGTNDQQEDVTMNTSDKRKGGNDKSAGSKNHERVMLHKIDIMITKITQKLNMETTDNNKNSESLKSAMISTLLLSRIDYLLRYIIF